MNILLILSAVFLGTLILGRGLERLRIPWIFAALLLGAVLSWRNPIADITNSAPFELLSDLGMYFLLFVVGLEVNLRALRKRSGFIVRTTSIVILLETVAGGLLLHALFDTSLLISGIVALSFATVGEAILVPILDESGLMNSRVGQSIIGVGSLDDIVELFMLVAVACLVGTGKDGGTVLLILPALLSLVGLTAAFLLLRPAHATAFLFRNIHTTLLLTMCVFCLFVGIGEIAHSAPIAAILAGIVIRNFLPAKRYAAIEDDVKLLCYGFFAPIFFFSVGTSVDGAAIATAPLLIALIALVSNGMKLFGSMLATRKELGNHGSILLGVGLSVRFSTSIIIVKILRENNFIDDRLYSIMIASGVIFTLAVPICFSLLMKRWDQEIRSIPNKD